MSQPSGARGPTEQRHLSAANKSELRDVLDSSDRKVCNCAKTIRHGEQVARLDGPLLVVDQLPSQPECLDAGRDRLARDDPRDHKTRDLLYPSWLDPGWTTPVVGRERDSKAAAIGR